MRFLTDLEAEKKDLIEQKKVIEKRLVNAPDGTLRIVKLRGKYPQYFQFRECDRDEKPNGTYIVKNKHTLAMQLAQKDYDKRALKEIDKQIAVITKFEKNYERNSVMQVYDGLAQERKDLVIPVVQTDEEFIEKWKSSKVLQHNTYPIENANYTENGEIVRSKSEMAIANKLALMGIPYVYEPMVKVGGIMLFPDFALLNVRTREEYYYEYFGMMDSSDYSIKTVNKLKTYNENGLVYGRNFLYTFEINSRIIDIREFEKLMKEYLL